MDPKDLMRGGSTSGPQFVVQDAFGTVRSTLNAEGAVIDPSGRVLAYIEGDGTVGSVDLQYIGEVTAAAAPTSIGFITDEDDKLIGKVDYGRAVIQDPQGSTIAELRKSGHVTGHLGASCGVLEGFDYHMLRSAAAYLMLVDRTFVQDK